LPATTGSPTGHAAGDLVGDRSVFGRPTNLNADGPGRAEHAEHTSSIR
jgi:hypothetical protein